MLLTREQALKVGKRSFATVFCDELEGELRLVSLSAGAQAAIRDLNIRAQKGEQTMSLMMVLLLEKSIVDEKGEQLFDNALAKEFFDKISSETLQLIINAVPGFKTPVAAAVPAGNSEAAPVVG